MLLGLGRNTHLGGRANVCSFHRRRWHSSIPPLHVCACVFFVSERPKENPLKRETEQIKIGSGYSAVSHCGENLTATLLPWGGQKRQKRDTADLPLSPLPSPRPPSQTLLSYCHHPLNFYDHPRIPSPLLSPSPPPPHTWCSSHSRMLFGVAVTASTARHPRASQPQPPLFLSHFCICYCEDTRLRFRLEEQPLRMHQKKWMGYFKTCYSLFSYSHCNEVNV